MALITYMTEVMFGAGALSELPAVLRRLAIGRPLLITDAGLVGAGLVARVTRAMCELPVFDDTPANPTEQTVLSALRQYRALECDGPVRGVAAIERAAHHHADDDARSAMMMASLEGGLSFQKGLGAIHAMSHALGSMPKPVLHHGTLNGVLLPAVLRFNAETCSTSFARIRAALGIPGATALSDYFRRLQARLGLPARLRDLGIDRAVLPQMATDATHDFSHLTNPRLASTADYLGILMESF